ncbi:MAG: hypothetical protein NTX52_01325 [Planctomycetota bacterium]|nr:hypothetical protein [Planctomycetota bacterium]
MRFSERMGKKKVKCDLQVESMDTDLRNGLWNVLYVHMVSKMQQPFGLYVDDSWQGVLNLLWHEFFKLPIDGIPLSASSVREWFKKWFFITEWYEVYDLLEFVGDLGPINTEEFKNGCNGVLERELSGYRFVGYEIAPITNKIEVNEVEQALEMSGERGLQGVRKHLESALEKLSDRKNPDYRNSIKESISAVESLCIIISKDKKATLGQALKKIEDAVGLHPALEKGFSSIYGYTSDEGGIRHAMIEDNPCDFDDAKYMLVSCSAFINYLIMKAGKAGLFE